MLACMYHSLLTAFCCATIEIEEGFYLLPSQFFYLFFFSLLVVGQSGDLANRFNTGKIRGRGKEELKKGWYLVLMFGCYLLNSY